MSYLGLQKVNFAGEINLTLIIETKRYPNISAESTWIFMKPEIKGNGISTRLSCVLTILLSYLTILVTLADL